MLLLPMLAVGGTRILMLGNSHTGVNDVPGLVRSILNADRRFAPVATEQRFGAFLEDMAQNREIMATVSSGRWDVIVLQAAKVSSSHKYRYSQAGAIQLAKVGKAAGARVLLFSEWPRRGWTDETEFTINVYRETASAAGVEIIPVGKSWDAYAKDYPKAPLWAPDGNHASLMGSTLAAYTIACWIRRGDQGLPIIHPSGLSPEVVSSLADYAGRTWRRSNPQ